ncbi:MAG: response regulator [Anaeromyxobacter sp.]
MKVLIADDDGLIRAMVSDLLSELGHSFVVAENGNEAVALAAREAPDVLVLDFLMPRLSGLDALKAIRAAGNRAPAILLSAISDASVRAVEGAAQVEVVLEKPVTKKALERALSRVKGGAR